MDARRPVRGRLGVNQVLRARVWDGIFPTFGANQVWSADHAPGTTASTARTPQTERPAASDGGGNAARLPCAILVANRTRTMRNGQLNRYDEQTITFDEPLRLLSGYYSALGAGSCSVGRRAMAYTDGAATSRRPREHTAAKNSWGSRPPYLKRR